MIIVIAYVRVSTKEQADRGFSLDGQKLQISEYAKLEGLKIGRWFSDESSARNEEEGSVRPDFRKACELAKKTGWPIIVVDASRFTRTEESYKSFIAEGGKLYDVLTGFGADKAIMGAKIKRAKFDGDKRSMATREGQARAKAAGKKFGTPTPLKGAAASAVVSKKEAAIRKGELERLCAKAAKEGVTEPKAIAIWLNRKGHLTAKGKPWTAGNVRERLRDQSGANRLTKAPIVFKSHPAAQGDDLVTLSPEELEAAHEILALLDESTRKAEDDFYKGNPDWGLF